MTTTANPPSATKATDEAAFAVAGMNCASCVAHVTKAAMKVDGVRSADVNLARGRAVVRFDPIHARADQIAAAITDAGYPSAVEPGETPDANAEEKRLARQAAHARSWFRRAVVGMVLWLPVEM